jgi:hypothetical protein
MTNDCDRCGEPSTMTWHELHVCDECYDWYDNYEPPEPDGECFRGHEAAGYQAEQMEQARRLK